MRYLIINGSPRKGNTWKLVELAKSQLLEIDDTTEFEEIHLANVNLPFCIGCSNCFRLGHEKCPHYSITNNIIQAIEKADGVIISSTTYNTRETALLKTYLIIFHKPIDHVFLRVKLCYNNTGELQNLLQSIAQL